jgi:NodT family efflux transporter outer membrane factor (OMF) lipoprotein
MVGPDYVPPAAPTTPSWIEAEQPGVRTATTIAERWWDTFQDPVLSRLVDAAYKQNLSLRSAGLRVIQAQARRAVAIGDLFPQEQALSGGYTRGERSTNAAFSLIGPRAFNTWQAGFDTVWELDLWGKFRRAIEAADSDLLAAVANYDDVLVSLIAEVAATYVRIRVLDERLAVARDNVSVQQRGLDFARVRFEAGGTSELDVQQATTLLKDTEATIQQLAIDTRQAVDSLCVLLGLPPTELAQQLGGEGRVPQVPTTMAVGIPADLLRRRPDVRRAEWAAAAQSARIGVSTAELLPSFQLAGSIGLRAEDAAKFFEGRSFEASTGPAFDWPVLNYGRLVNNVRLQDATFQELAVSYANTVLTAQQEVEDALIGYLRGTDQVELLRESVAAAERAVELSFVQYREGATDFTSVLNTQQSKLREGDLLASTRGAVALSVIALNKALGGGWEIRDGQDFVPDQTREEMRARTYWGSLLPPETRARDVDRAAAETADRRGRRWRWWWPEW